MSCPPGRRSPPVGTARSPTAGAALLNALLGVLWLVPGAGGAAEYLACIAPPPPPAFTADPPAASRGPTRSELIVAARSAHGGPFELLDGWLRLIDLATRREQGDPGVFAGLDEWLRHFPEHPGREYALRMQPATAAPAPVLALLPLSGPFALAGEQVAAGLRAVLGPELAVMDVGSGPLPLEALADRLEATRPALLVGPLVKEQVAELAGRQPPLPTLALNTAPAGGPRFLRFALMPEDEGRALAERVAVEVGKGCGEVRLEPGESGRRLLEGFRERLTELGGCLGESAGEPPAFLLLAGGEAAGVPLSLADPPVYASLRAAGRPGLRLVGPPLAAGQRTGAPDDAALLRAFGRDAGRLARSWLAGGGAPMAVDGETGRLAVTAGGEVRRALTMLRSERGRLRVEGCGE